MSARVCEYPSMLAVNMFPWQTALLSDWIHTRVTPRPRERERDRDIRLETKTTRKTDRDT